MTTSTMEYLCTIVDSNGFVVEEFKHRQPNTLAASKFESMVLEAVRGRSIENGPGDGTVESYYIAAKEFQE